VEEDTLSDISTLPYLPRSPRYSPTDPVVSTFFLGGWGGGLCSPFYLFFFLAVQREHLAVDVRRPLENRRLPAILFFIEKTPKNNKK
jgi:hypothetical protein